MSVFLLVSLIASLGYTVFGWRVQSLKSKVRDEQRRHDENDRVRAIFKGAGAVHYSHRLASGAIRWYRVDHEYAAHK